MFGISAFSETSFSEINHLKLVDANVATSASGCITSALSIN